MYRSRKTTKKYNPAMTRKRLEAKQVVCPFCELGGRKVKKNGEHVMVIDNLFPYEHWDQRNVVEHLLLIPKRHVLTLGELTDEERIEITGAMAEYEAAGYNIYWRAETNASRSVPHQHTHLFKLGDKQTRAMLYTKHPYFVVRV